MNPNHTIYIPSKGRASRVLTARELDMMNVQYKVVVEPVDYDEYCKYIKPENILVLPFSNLGQGSVPARNWIWEYSISKGEVKHWILDDNIEGFHRLNRNVKPKVTSGTIFKCAELFVSRFSNVALAGFNYYSFCKCTDSVPPFYLNTRIYSCILINNFLDIRWRGKYNEDTDLSLRLLKNGYCTILFNAFLIGKVTTQRMKGGNTDLLYAKTDNRKEFAESLRDQHPDVVKVTWKFNRWHHQVDYRRFKINKLQPINGNEDITGVNNFGMRLISI